MTVQRAVALTVVSLYSLLLTTPAASFAPVSVSKTAFRSPQAQQQARSPGFALYSSPAGRATSLYPSNATCTDSLQQQYNYNNENQQIDSMIVQDIKQQYQDWQNQVVSGAGAVTTIDETYTDATTTTTTTSLETTTTTTTQEEQDEKDKAVQQARMLLLAAAALYGTNFSLVKLLGATDIPVGVCSSLRFGMAALATSPWLFQKVQGDDSSANANPVANMALPDGREVAAMLAGMEVGMWNSIGYVAQAVGLETTTASKSAFLCSLAVVVVPILDFLAGKLLLPKQVIGAVLALAGVAMLELGGMESSELALTSGDVASLIQPLAFGMGFWRMEKAMHQFPDQANRSTAAQLLAVFMGSALYTAVTEPGMVTWEQVQHWMTDPMIVASLFWTGCITTAMTVYMETIALKTLSAAETTLIFSTEPLWGTAFAAVVMGEQLGPAAAVGAVFILSGCLFSNLGVEGIKAFFQGKDQDETNDDTNAPRMPGAITANFEMAAPMSNQWTLFRTGVAASIGSSGVWNELDVGTKVVAMQLEDFMENFFLFADH